MLFFMRGTLCLLMGFMLGVASLAWADQVESFRHRSKLIAIGDSKLGVADKCGDPDRKEKSFDRLGEVDVWTYNFGASDFIYVLQFRNDELVSIDQGSRGHMNAKRNAIAPTDCRIEITDWTQHEESIHVWIKGIVKNKGGLTGKRVWIEVRAFDRQGKLINLERSPASSTKLAPGKEASFEVGIKKNPQISKFVPTVTWEPDI